MTKEKNSGTIWNDLKNRKMDVFNLPSQTVEMYFEPVSEDEKKLILKRVKNLPLGAALPALEQVLSEFVTVPEKKKGPQPFGTPKPTPKFKYQLEQQNDYLIIHLTS